MRPRPGRGQRLAEAANVVADHAVAGAQAGRDDRCPHPAIGDAGMHEGEGRTRAFVVEGDPGGGRGRPGACERDSNVWPSTIGVCTGPRRGPILAAGAFHSTGIRTMAAA